MIPDTFVNLFSYSKYIILMKLVVHKASLVSIRTYNMASKLQ